MIAALQFLDSIVEATWQQFSTDFEKIRIMGGRVEWQKFYCFCGRQSLNREQARLLARLWEGDRRVLCEKHGLSFIVEQPATPVEVQK